MLVELEKTYMYVARGQFVGAYLFGWNGAPVGHPFTTGARSEILGHNQIARMGRLSILGLLMETPVGRF